MLIGVLHEDHDPNSYRHWFLPVRVWIIGRLSTENQDYRYLRQNSKTCKDGRNYCCSLNFSSNFSFFILISKNSNCDLQISAEISIGKLFKLVTKTRVLNFSRKSMNSVLAASGSEFKLGSKKSVCSNFVSKNQIYINFV